MISEKKKWNSQVEVEVVGDFLEEGVNKDHFVVTIIIIATNRNVEEVKISGVSLIQIRTNEKAFNLHFSFFSDSGHFRGRDRGSNNFSGGSQKSFQNFSNQGGPQSSSNYTPQQNRGRGGSSLKDKARRFMNQEYGQQSSHYGQSDHQDTSHRLQALANYGGQTDYQSSRGHQQQSVQKGWHSEEQQSQFHERNSSYQQNSNFGGNFQNSQQPSHNLNRPRPPKRPMKDDSGYEQNRGNKLPVKRQFTTWDLPQMDPNLPSEIKALCTSSKCHLCEVTITSYNLCFMHYAGKIHAKKVKAKLEANLMANPPSHDQMLDLLGIQEPLSSETMAKLTIQKCHFCQTTFPSMEIAKMHYKGKKHAKAMTKVEQKKINDQNAAKTMETITAEGVFEGLTSELAEKIRYDHCGLCCSQFVSPDVALEHYRGPHHSNSVKIHLGIPTEDLQFKNEDAGGSEEILETFEFPDWEEFTSNWHPDVVNKCQPNKCLICAASLTSMQFSKSHYMGKRHSINVFKFLSKLYPEESFSSPSDVKKEITKNTSEITNDDESEIHAWMQEFEEDIPEDILNECTIEKCGICNISGNPGSIKAHYKGKGHKSKIRLQLNIVKWSHEMKANFHPNIVQKCSLTNCEICGLAFTNQNEGLMHYKSNKHVAAVEKYLQENCLQIHQFHVKYEGRQ